MSEEPKYIRDEPVEKKGKMKWDKWQKRQLKLTKDAVLEYWTIPERIEDGEPVRRNAIILLEEGLNDCKPNKSKGKQFKHGWQIQTDGRIYNFASPDSEARNIWIRKIQDTYQIAKNAAKSQANAGQIGKKTSKKWGSALKSFKQTAKSGGLSGMGSALKNLSKDAAEIKKSNFREKKEAKRKANIKTLDTSSIFGCYLKDNELKQEEIIEMKRQQQQQQQQPHNDEEEKKTNDENGNDDEDEKDEKKEEKHDHVDDIDENPVINANPMISITLNELLNANYQTFSSKLGAKGSRFNKETLFNDDLIVSNEFCQLAIGKGLVRGKTKDKDKNETEKEEKQEKQETEEKKEEEEEEEDEDKKYLRINKRPKHDSSDDDEEDDDFEGHIVARNDGKLRDKIEFKPREYGEYPNKGNFSICCEIYCEDLGAGNTILSNRVDDRGFEFIAPRAGSRRIAIWRDGSKLLNVGATELFQDCWYHIAVVCERANTDVNNQTTNVKKLELRKKQEEELHEEKKEQDKKKKEKFKISSLTNMSGKEMAEKLTGKTNITSAATDFSVYLNGVLDGKLSLDGVVDIDTLACRVGSAVDMSMNSCFAGKIKHFEIYDKALNEENIYNIAHRHGMMSLKAPVLLSYRPTSLKVEVPDMNSIKYNGPLHAPLPGHLQWQPGLGSFTISAWIICSRAVSKKGSVIISNLTTGNNGFELICPTSGTGVMGIRCTGFRDDKDGNGLSIGTTKIEKNKCYHIAVSVERIITYGAIADQTSIVVYLNGKQDGSYNIATMLTYTGGDWTIGFNSHYKSESSFEGSIANVRLLQRCLCEAEIACLYAADKRERSFVKNEEILYCDTKQDGKGRKEAGEKTNEHLTFLPNYQWQKGIFIKANMNDGKARIKNKDGAQKTVQLNKIIKLETKISQFVPGTDSSEITNLGGMIHGVDFEGNKWRIYSSETSFLRHITAPSCFTLLSKLKPFPKHSFEQMIDNEWIDNKYILNRLLNAAHELLRKINQTIVINKDPVTGKDKKVNVGWHYFNEYILPWKVWKEKINFESLQEVARRLQKKYKDQQFSLYERLCNEKHWDTFDIKNIDADPLTCRQDAFDGGLTTECDKDAVGDGLAIIYDQKVSSHILWGRCFLLNDAFQTFFKKLFENAEKYTYEKGPQKTYERMIEKTVEYQSEGKKFPAAYQICDVLRCSVRCKSLDDIDDAYYAVEKNIKIIRVKNRFLPSFKALITDGYRDMLVNVLFKDDVSGLATIGEVQFHLQEYIDIKHKQHKYYKIVRAQDYKALLRNYEARKFDD